jgi:hypothetical protein
VLTLKRYNPSLQASWLLRPQRVVTTGRSAPSTALTQAGDGQGGGRKAITSAECAVAREEVWCVAVLVHAIFSHHLFTPSMHTFNSHPCSHLVSVPATQAETCRIFHICGFTVYVHTFIHSVLFTVVYSQLMFTPLFTVTHGRGHGGVPWVAGVRISHRLFTQYIHSVF